MFDRPLTIIEACKTLDISIPSFCYHPRLKIAGNCRMCLVEVGGGDQPKKIVPSCHHVISDGMNIHTHSPNVQHAQQSVLELLLIHHPLDCPVCDQAGECDLQNFTLHYGMKKSRYGFFKRSVREKNLGPLVKTAMARCIHCTRCTRFLDDLVGRAELVMINRGEESEITNYDHKPLSSPLSGNIIDLCPVGALNNKPNSYQGRCWEYTRYESIDILDSVGATIYLDCKNNQVKRVLPRPSLGGKGDWISDKIRFCLDGLSIQRLDQPYQKNNERLVPISWDEAIKTVAHILATTPCEKVGMLVGNMVDQETVFLLKQLSDGLGIVHRDCRTDFVLTPLGSPKWYQFNTSIDLIGQSDAILLVGSELEHENPVLYLHLYDHCKRNHVPIFIVAPEKGPLSSLYEGAFLGNTLEVLSSMDEGHACYQAFAAAKKPMLILCPNALNNDHAQDVYHWGINWSKTHHVVREGWNGFNVVLGNMAQIGALNLGFVPGHHGYNVHEMIDHWQDFDVIYLVGVDDDWAQDLVKNNHPTSKKPTIIYQGHHFDYGAALADIILPGLAFSEKKATYTNIEGIAQQTTSAMTPPAMVKHECDILVEIMTHLSRDDKKDCWDRFLSDDQAWRDLFAKEMEMIKQSSFDAWRWPLPCSNHKNAISFPHSLRPFLKNFYQSDVITRNSPTMAKCRLALESLINAD